MYHLPLYDSAIAELYKLRRALDAVIAGYEHEDIDLLKTIPGCGEVFFQDGLCSSFNN